MSDVSAEGAFWVRVCSGCSEPDLRSAYGFCVEVDGCWECRACPSRSFDLRIVQLDAPARRSTIRKKH